LRFDTHFIARHPTTLFQCLWNTAWWYDCPEAERYYTWDGDAGNPPPWHRPGPKLSERLEGWRPAKEAAAPGLVWVRSWRPPPRPLGSGLLAELSGRGPEVLCVTFSPDGRRVAAGSRHAAGRVWDADTGAELARLEGYAARVMCVAFSPDGRRVATASDDH